jgi:ABC-type amino acid transport substrate-binding protein
MTNARSNLEKVLKLLGVCFLLFVVDGILSAEEGAGPVIRAGVHTSPPFVMDDGSGGFNGMAVDLWNMISGALGRRTEYREYRSVDELLAALQSGEIDVLVTNLTVTHARTQNLKFTYPWYDSGLRLMVNADSGTSFWGEFNQNGRVAIYTAFVVLFLIIVLLLTIFMRRRDPTFTRSWRDGLFCCLYEAIITFRSGRLMRDFGWVGHALGSIWMIFGVAVVAYITSTITSSMTTVSLSRDGIGSLGDLTGKSAGLLAGSASEEFMSDRGIFLKSFNNIDEAGNALAERQVQSVIADAPVLEYWAVTHPEKKVKVTGDLFRPEKYAFACGTGSALADAVSIQLIRLHENRSIQRLRSSYFGQAADRKTREIQP